MVTAGVYLIVRTHAIFEQAPKIADLAAGLGALTLLVAGLIALVQVDIKRVIAYSTMSQIGYMFLGAGIGSYPNAMFHLMTHAFFKALLFMAAGIVIHALVNEQDISKMGGLRQLAPKTYWGFLIGSLALGRDLPVRRLLLEGPDPRGRDGSRDVRLRPLGRGPRRHVPHRLYAFRLLFIVFWGEPSAFVREHFHPLGRDVVAVSLAIPVGVLAVLSTIGGWIQFSPWCIPVETWLRTGRRADRLAGVVAGVALDRGSRSCSALSGHRGRVVDVRSAPGRSAPRCVGAAHARAQVLLRRGVRRALLRAGRVLGEVPAPRVSSSR
jgi:NADH-quinone oxidoreductase subunit L